MTALPTTPAGQRNLAPLTEILAARLPPRGNVLEMASGTGQHVAHWARTFPALVFQPSDADPACRENVAAWCAAHPGDNLRAPLAIDATAGDWSDTAPGPWNAILVVNLLHVAPWSASEGLIAGAGRTLTSGGRVFVYGPFAVDGTLEPESNRQFDAALRSQDPRWGIRDRRDVARLAEGAGLRFAEDIAMPANNRVLVFERAPCA